MARKRMANMKLRLTPAMHARICRSALLNGVPLNTEITRRLELSYVPEMKEMKVLRVAVLGEIK